MIIHIEDFVGFSGNGGTSCIYFYGTNENFWSNRSQLGIYPLFKGTLGKNVWIKGIYKWETREYP